MGAVLREVKERFEQQVLERVLSSNVYDKSVAGPDLGDVSEVLIWAYPDIDPSMDSQFLHFIQRVQVRSFIGYVIVVPERAVLLRDPVHKLGESAGT